MTGSTGLITHDSWFDFLPQTLNYVNTLPNFPSGLSGLLLLAAFPKPVESFTSSLDP